MSKSDVSFVNGYLLKDPFAFSSLCYNEIGTICYDKNQIFSTHKKVINFWVKWMTLMRLDDFRKVVHFFKGSVIWHTDEK